MTTRAELACEGARLLSACPPDALVTTIELLVEQVEEVQTAFEDGPSRAEVRRKLSDLRDAAIKVASLLDDLSLGELMRRLRGDGSGNKIRLTPERLRWLAEDAEWLLEYVPAGRGSRRLLDELGMPRGRFLCAASVVRLWDLVRGRPPDKENPTARQLCALIWQAAGGRTSEAVEEGDVADLAAWERHIATVREAIKDDNLTGQAVGAWMTIGDIFNQTGIRDVFPFKTLE